MELLNIGFENAVTCTNAISLSNGAGKVAVINANAITIRTYTPTIYGSVISYGCVPITTNDIRQLQHLIAGNKDNEIMDNCIINTMNPRPDRRNVLLDETDRYFISTRLRAYAKDKHVIMELPRKTRFSIRHGRVYLDNPDGHLLGTIVELVPKLNMYIQALDFIGV